MSKGTQEIIFKTLMNLPERKYTTSGKQTHNLYGYDMDHKYIVGLSKTGEENTYEKIQMHADECKIETILAKAAVDPTILNQRKGIFADTSEMPKSMSEFMNLRIKIINGWETLDIETKKQFNNNVNEYLAEYGSEKWLKALGVENKEDLVDMTMEMEQKIAENETKGEELNE